mgnify:CR=1 FL=1|jgi:SMC interacting uncharacterized protein involved in chromosome segregation
MPKRVRKPLDKTEKPIEDEIKELKELKVKVPALEQTVRSLGLEVNKLRKENEALKKEVEKVSSEKERLAEMIEKRPVTLESPESLRIIRPHEIVEKLGSAISEVGAEPKYVVSSIEVEMATHIDRDEEGNVFFKIISPFDKVESTAVDRVKFSIKPAVTSFRPTLIEVPALVGLTLEDARKILKEAGLELGSVTKHKSLTAEGVVIGQSPEKGYYVKPKMKVDVVVAAK